MKKEPRVFISYSHKDRDTVSKIMESLRAKNVTAWSEASLKPGDRWEEELEKNLRESDVYVLIVSREALGSDFFMFEAGVAFGRAEKDPSVRVIPVVVSDVGWDEVPFVLRRYKGIDGASVSPEEIGRAVAEAL